jgi:hypothetical protein
LIGEFELFTDLGNDFDLACFAYKAAGNDYKFLPYKIGPKPLCDFIDEEKLMYPDLQSKTDFPDASVCPWTPRVYKIHGYQPDLEKLPPILDSGDYMVECQLLKDGAMVNGMQVYGSVLNIPMAVS